MCVSPVILDRRIDTVSEIRLGKRADTHLVNSASFKRVYARGRRFDGRFVTVYILPNNGPRHRLGITSSRKAVGNAVERNRAKRLLREAFRLNSDEVKLLGGKYDWVLNARRYLLRCKVNAPLEELKTIISRIKREEGISDSVS